MLHTRMRSQSLLLLGVYETKPSRGSISVQRSPQRLVQELHLVTTPALSQHCLAISSARSRTHRVSLEESREHIEREDLRTKHRELSMRSVSKVWSSID